MMLSIARSTTLIRKQNGKRNTEHRRTECKHHGNELSLFRATALRNYSRGIARFPLDHSPPAMDRVKAAMSSPSV